MNDPNDGDGVPEGAVRARGLAELAHAVSQAQQAAERYGFAGEHAVEARALKARLEAIRLEIEDLRRGGWRSHSRELGSKWIRIGPGEAA